MNICFYDTFYDIDDTELMNIINYDFHHFPLNVLNSLNFTSFHVAESFNHDIVNLYQPILHEPVRDYVFHDELLTQTLLSYSIKILSCNICSIPKHLDSLSEQYLSSSATDLDVIGLCELLPLLPE